MNLYLISQSKNNDYDTYNSAVVVAPSEEIARRIHPSFVIGEDEPEDKILPLTETDFRFLNPVWVEPDDWYYFGSEWDIDVRKVKVKFIGTTDIYNEPRVICASFNAG